MIVLFDNFHVAPGMYKTTKKSENECGVDINLQEYEKQV
jgi:hypothetical protein